MIKILLASAAFAVALASPAFAQSFDPDLGSGNITPPAATYTPGYSQAAPAPRYAPPVYGGGFGAYAQEPAWNGLPEGLFVPYEPCVRTRVRR
jgi:hypothetical protein